MKGIPSPPFDRQFPLRHTAVYGTSAKSKRMIFFDVDDTLINQRKAERQAVAAPGALRRLAGTIAKRKRFVLRVARASRQAQCGFFLPAKFRCRNSGDGACASFSRGVKKCCRAAKRISSLPVTSTTIGRTGAYSTTFCHSSTGWAVMAAASLPNGSTAQQKLKLQQTGIAHHFDVVVVAEEIGVAKPERDIFIAACEEARCPAASCVYVGHSLERDALASAAAGLRPFLLDRECAQADARVETIGSLYELRCRLASGIAE